MTMPGRGPGAVAVAADPACDIRRAFRRRCEFWADSSWRDQALSAVVARLLEVREEPSLLVAGERAFAIHARKLPGRLSLPRLVDRQNHALNFDDEAFGPIRMFVWISFGISQDARPVYHPIISDVRMAMHPKGDVFAHEVAALRCEISVRLVSNECRTDRFCRGAPMRHHDHRVSCRFCFFKKAASISIPCNEVAGA